MTSGERTPLDIPTLDELRRRTSVKWRAHAPDVLPLWVAEMDASPCPPVVDAVTAALRSGDTGYDHGTRYAESFAAFARRRWDWTFDPSATRALPDVMIGIVEVLRVLTGPGDAVVVNPPVYPPFYGFPRNEGRRVVEAPLGTDLRLDLAALEVAFADATGAAANGSGSGSGRRAVYLLCNPHNPTGTVHTRAELEAVLALANRHGVRVVADEIHAPIVEPGVVHVPLLSVDGSDDAVVLLSASKAWNLAGLKAAVAVGGPGAADDLRRIPEEAAHGVSHVGVIAHAAALDHGETWLDAVLAAVARNRREFSDLLAEHLPSVVSTPAEGTYFAWLDCRALPGIGGVDPGRWFLTEGRVALNAGDPFGPGGRGRVRVNLATGRPMLAEAVRRMAEAVARL